MASESRFTRLGGFMLRSKGVSRDKFDVYLLFPTFEDQIVTCLDWNPYDKHSGTQATRAWPIA